MFRPRVWNTSWFPQQQLTILQYKHIYLNETESTFLWITFSDVLTSSKLLFFLNRLLFFYSLNKLQSVSSDNAQTLIIHTKIIQYILQIIRTKINARRYYWKMRKKLGRLWKTQVTAICFRDRLQNFACNIKQF